MIKSDSRSRCPWCLGFAQYIAYHDTEWGVPTWDDRIHFEFIVLESAQAGLSWATILKKRAAYRLAFADFDYQIVADFPESYVQELLRDSSIIRNVLKIRAAINNARCFIKIREEFGSFSTYIWGFVGGNPKQNRINSLSEIRATTAESDLLAKDLKKRGFKFLGSTTLYAHMQATGLVNDHLVSCFRQKEVEVMVNKKKRLR